jgi:hypothetical protein
VEHSDLWLSTLVIRLGQLVSQLVCHQEVTVMSSTAPVQTVAHAVVYRKQLHDQCLLSFSDLDVRYTVGDFGLFTATIPAHSAIAIHTGATGSGSGFATVNFAPTVTTVNGETVYVTGNLEQLGGWEPLVIHIHYL